MELVWALLLLAQAPAPPAAVLKLPAELKVEAEKAVQLEATTDGKAVRWKVLDPGIVLIPPDATDKKVWVYGSRAGRYRVWAWTAIGDMPSEIVETIIVVAGVPGPGPGPGPGPVPPADLVGRLQAAYAADSAAATIKKSQLALLSGLYEAMAEHTVRKDAGGAYVVKTTDKLRGDLAELAKQMILPGALVDVRKVIAGEVAATLGAESVELSPAMRAAAGDLFKRIAGGLDQVK